MADEQNIRGLGRDRSLPTPGNQGEMVVARATKYGELFTSPLDRQRLADESSYFIAHNATNDAATTLAGHVAPVLADVEPMTKPFIFIRVPAGATKRVYLDYIELDLVLIGASGTEDNWADQLDTGTTRWSSAGTALTLVNPNMQSSDVSMFSGQTNHLLGGAVVAGAESASARRLGHGQISDTIMVAGDRYLFAYGHTPTLGTVDRHVITRPPIVLGATDQYLLALYAPSQAATAAVYKVRMAWAER